MIKGVEEDIDYMLRKLKKEYDKLGLYMNMKTTKDLRIGEEDADSNLQL